MKEMFLDDGREKIIEIDNQIQSLEKDKDDEYALVELYRIIHSFKGMAGTVELKNLENFFHQLESFISEIQDGRYGINEITIDLLYDLLDFVEESLDMVENNKKVDKIVQKHIKLLKNTKEKLSEGLDSEDADQLRIKELLSQHGLEDLGSGSIDFENSDANFYLIKVVIERNIKLKLARLLVILKNIKGKGQIIKSFPPLSDLLEEKFDEEFQFLFYSDEDKPIVKDALFKSGEIESINIETLSGDEAKSILRDEQEKDEIEAAEVSIEKTKEIDSAKVKLDLIDKQVELFGELLISSKQLGSVVEKFNNTEANEILFQMQNYLVNLQDVILKMQLVPISTVFRPFPRMIRMLARRQDKSVDLKIKHHDVKVDRKILNHIGDIINHLIRNAISHGVEKPGERLRKNKRQKAKLLVETSIENNVLSLIVKDDGKGVDPEKIGALAVEKSIFTQNEIDNMSDEEIINIIFSPNFSSAENITNVSGRGLGLNIVKEKVESLNGTINIETKVDKGTTFKVLLPLSKTLIRALLVKTGDEIYTIALDDIERLLEIPINKIQKDGDKYFYTNEQDNNIIEIHDLGRLFSLYKHSRIENKGKTVKVVYVKKGNKYLGLVVDDFIKESEIVIKEIDDVDHYTQGISGAAILEDGRVSLIIDPFTILN